MGTPQEEQELLKKIERLEAGHVHLKQEMSKLKLSESRHRQRSHSLSPQRSRLGAAASSNKGSSNCSPLKKEGSSSDQNDGEGYVRSDVNLCDSQYLNILQSMGQSVYILDLQCRIIYWNPGAENLYGYTAEDVLGRDGIELLVEPIDFTFAYDVFSHVKMGDSWTGQFPAKHKMGERVLAVVTNTPFYDDDGSLVGIICVSGDSRPFLEIRNPFSGVKNSEPDYGSHRLRSTLGLDSQQPLQVALASKFSSLASKVSNNVKSRMRMRMGENNIYGEDGSGECHHHFDHSFSDCFPSDQREEDANSSGASTPRGDVIPSPFRDSGKEREGKPIHKIITSKAEAWIQKKSLSWPWRSHNRAGCEATDVQGACPWLQSEQENEPVNLKNFSSRLKPESQVSGSNRPVDNETSGSWSSFNANSTSSTSSSGSDSSGAVNSKVDMDTDSSNNEILWEDLTIGDQVGEGSCGSVYHGQWYESDVAVKVFSKQKYSDDVILSFRQELPPLDNIFCMKVSVLKRLRHPNILLFMGAVTSPQRLCIVTEFLPRGSLFRLLQRNTTKLDKRRRVHMALDIARGVNYLHHCNPPIIHRDLKSSNLLVDKNWTVKVGDFGLSPLKHETYLTTKTQKGTPQWMAPEVLRNEPSDEKSDIYSFGVILWELVTEKIPWDTLNAMQVVGAVGFMNHRLEIPQDVDPQWASIIESCWHSDPASRPTLLELLERLRELLRGYTLQLQATRTAAGVITQKES